MSKHIAVAKAPGFYSFKIGDFDVVALHDGVLSFPRPPGFISNISDEEAGEAFASAGMPRANATLTFNALAISTGQGVVLIDTGFGAGGPPGTGQLVANLAAAGVQPGDVSSVIVSHFHADHIGGLLRADGAPSFPNAEILAPAGEAEFWLDEARAAAAPEGLKGTFAQSQKVFGALAKATRRFAGGAEILPGFTAIDAHGHTPGMSAIRIASGSDETIFLADVTNNPLIFARHPEWRLMFDMDPAAAIETRKKLLDQVAADKTRVSFYHAPFPATGYVVKSGGGYEFLPALWSSNSASAT